MGLRRYFEQRVVHASGHSEIRDLNHRSRKDQVFGRINRIMEHATGIHAPLCLISALMILAETRGASTSRLIAETLNDRLFNTGF